MPASSIHLYHMHDAKNNFNAVRPAPFCTSTSSFMSQCQNIHISTNCYYGYHDAKNTESKQEFEDCEMAEISNETPNLASVSPHCKGRKRSADSDTYIQNKRLREEVQKKIKEPETTETKKLDTSSEEYLETLYWSTHGGTLCYVNI